MRAAFALFFILSLFGRSALAEPLPVGAGRPIPPVSAGGLAHVGATKGSAQRSAARTADTTVSVSGAKAMGKRPPPPKAPRKSVVHLAFGFEMRACAPAQATRTSAVTLRLEVPAAPPPARPAAAPAPARPQKNRVHRRAMTAR
jgi:hypothetical protein